MSASDIILARTELRKAINHLRLARVGVSAERRAGLDARINALTDLVLELNRALYEANQAEGVRA